MLGKLLKYEFKSTLRLFLPIYAAAIVFALLCRLFISVNTLQNFWDGRLFAIVMMIYVVIILMTSVLTLVLIIQRFYKNLLKDEGYLSNTLPVSVDTHIWGKAIPAAAWYILSFIVIIASLFIMLSTKEILASFTDVSWGSSINTSMDMPVGLLAFELIVLMVISVFSSIMTFYAALCIGQLANNHKILLSIVAYFCLGIIVSMITIAITSSSMFVGDGSYYTGTYANSLNITTGMVTQTLGVTAIIEIVIGVIYYFVARYILSRRLNLE